MLQGFWNRFALKDGNDINQYWLFINWLFYCLKHSYLWIQIIMHQVPSPPSDLNWARGVVTLTPVGVRLGVRIPHWMAEVCGGCCYKSCTLAAVAHGRLENAHLGTALDTLSPAAGGAGMGLQGRNIPQFYMAWYVCWSTFCSFTVTVTSTEIMMTFGFRKLKKTGPHDCLWYLLH